MGGRVCGMGKLRFFEGWMAQPGGLVDDLPRPWAAAARLRCAAMKAVKKKAQASERVRGEWLRRVEAEYRSAAVTQHLTLWLIQIGASPDLLRAGLRIAGGDMTPASMSHRVYRAAGGEGGPQLVRESLELRRTPGAPLEEDVVRVGMEVFCLGETV